MSNSTILIGGEGVRSYRDPEETFRKNLLTIGLLQSHATGWSKHESFPRHLRNRNYLPDPDQRYYNAIPTNSIVTLLPFVLAYRLPANLDASGISPWGENVLSKGGERKHGKGLHVLLLQTLVEWWCESRLYPSDS
ncbi:hypothetical protein CFAM422_001686 [Trichoderma lentiforme]|uniref:Uncharacterized protein n=1 Tax=Trichoderma lentiforme TaxID=1567552 RepID=A0A9P5CIT3_9HYPO|nr:hypothetical protein CFAM422_001686 [Trichoderma lentiforme]